MAATGKRNDHNAVAFFKVEIDNIESATFRKCGGLKTETEVFEFQEGGNNESVYKLVGQSKASNIVLTKGFISSPELFSWREEVATPTDKPVKRRNGAIVCLGPDGKTELSRWNFQKAWPVRWEMTEFDSSTGQAACETLELAVEKIVKG